MKRHTYEYGDAVIVTRGWHKGPGICRVYSPTSRFWCGTHVGWRLVVYVLLPSGPGVQVMNADVRPARDTQREKAAWIKAQQKRTW